MSEAMAYARCHGARGSEIVRVTRVEARLPPVELAPVTGETLRAAFEARLLERGP